MAATPTEQGNNPVDNNSRTKAKKDRQGRKYGFACANCRRRKAKCDGGVPSCSRCLAGGEDCVFNKVPSVTYALTLQNTLSSYESLMSNLRSSSGTERLRLLEEYFGGGSDMQSNHGNRIDEHIEGSPQSEISAGDGLADVLEQTSVDQDGRICFYGTTSLFHLRPTDPALYSRFQTSITADTTDAALLEGREPQLTAQHQNSLRFSTDSLLNDSTILSPLVVPDNQLYDELLETYWCWPHHLHLVLCRKIFMRDMATSGPYFNQFLLYSVLSQAARFSDRQDAPALTQYFAREALSSLTIELDKGSSIPTIQALLIFSARECACGRTSQGWLYSGMAFRMMRDLGIHIPSAKLGDLVGQFSSEELALRKQLFWSCFTWDKTMSLCLGRAPAIHDVIPAIVPEDMLDGEEAESGIWRPKFACDSALEGSGSQKARTNSRFTAYCELCIIINEVLDILYSKPHATQQNLHGFFDRTMQKLRAWANALPPHLYVRKDLRTISCPPLHILTLNLLYHATIILLCRPYRSTQVRARKTATSAAEMIDCLFVLHVRRFGFRVITWLESYTIFVASTVNILDLKEGIDTEAASSRLALGLEVLRNASSTPSNIRCVEIIQRLLRKDEKQKGKEGSSKAQDDILTRSAVDNGFQAIMKALSTPFSTQFRFPDGTSSFVETAQGGPVAEFPDWTGINCSTTAPPLNLTTDVSVNAMTTPVEAPLRWLPENVGNQFAWMMIETDFGTYDTVSTEMLQA